MKLYSYKGKTETGKILHGEIKADSVEKVKEILRDKGYSSIEVVEKKKDYMPSFLKKGVKTKELALFCRQFAIILQAGVPIAVALDVLRTQTANPTLRKSLSSIYENMQRGISLSASMKGHRAIFPDLLTNMVEAGEVSGQLEEVFDRMAENYEKEAKLTQKVKASLTYPIIVCVVAVAVIAVMMIKVVPSFVKILRDFKVELPMITKVLIGISNFFVNYWIQLLIGIIIGVVVVKAILKSKSGKDLINQTLLNIPILGSIIVKITTARFTRTLSVLLASGVLLIQSLEIVQKIIGNSVVQSKIGEVIEDVKKGKGLFTPLQKIKFFPMMVTSMVKIGEESGELDMALNKCADYYDNEVETGLQQATALIEPIVMVVMAVVVGFILLSILFPMFSIYENIDKL